MNYSLHSNLSNICRTCLTESSSMKSVFSYEQVMEQKILLGDMLMSCTSILIIHGDGLPENICENCSQQVHTTYLFQKLCERSDATLRECTAITDLNSDHSNIFTIEIESSKFDMALEEKSLSDHEQNEINIKNESCQTVFDGMIDMEPNNLDESNDDDATLKPNKGSLSPDRSDTSISGDKVKTVFKCEHCSKEFNAKSFLCRHMTVHKNNPRTTKHRSKSGVTRKRNQPRTCEICNKTFRFHSNLERHKLTHTGEKPFLCNVCGKGFAQMAYLKIHSFIHTGEKPYKCQMCDRSFAAPGTLMTHVRTHTGERPHICKICGKDFPQSGYLSAHIRTHTGEKPIECKVCNRRFNQSGRLIVHMRIHSGEKPYQCTTCGRSFAVKGTLKKHIRTHTGEKPYKCKECGQAFAQSGTLANHMKTHKSKGENDKLVSWRDDILV